MKKNERFWLMHLHKSVFFCIFAGYFCARMYSVHDKVRDEIREKIMTNPQNPYNQPQMPAGQMMAPPPMAGGGQGCAAAKEEPQSGCDRCGELQGAERDGVQDAASVLVASMRG